MTTLNKMEKFNLSEWLKDKSRKVVTRSGIKVEIIHDENPLVAIINGVAYNFDNDGKFQSNKSNHKYDLFFADEKDDLTEFEKELEMMMVSFSNGNLGSDVRKEMPKQKLHNCAHRLLDLARKKLEKSIEDGAIEFAKSYMEDVNPSFEKVQESEELWKWKMSCLRGVNKAYTNGKQDALKDLPKWKRCVGSTGPFIDDFRGEDYLYLKDYVIKVAELFEKLPKEEE